MSIATQTQMTLTETKSYISSYTSDFILKMKHGSVCEFIISVQSQKPLSQLNNLGLSGTETFLQISVCL